MPVPINKCKNVKWPYPYLVPYSLVISKKHDSSVFFGSQICLVSIPEIYNVYLTDLLFFIASYTITILVHVRSTDTRKDLLMVLFTFL
uniref:Uncharacterized protein n=1 Tax=Pyxicephalus adspersus TaxID=30357 RepID=A0AAV3AC71_PYXAD|nr:TPA: hypothetical protein GDO54_017632 [Pyxicephalus adspersus]